MALHSGCLTRLADWTDTHALRALLAHGHDLAGNLLPGDHCPGSVSRRARARNPITTEQKAEAYMPAWRVKPRAAERRDRQPGASNPSSPPTP
jgi:hypothetical protein